ncbi:MAG: aldehyde dehydrogenase family protein [Hyphomicrobiaceae bacterium]|nr:aldehyde dehydrogenase family protein [Hyphomicrobiaceae bacterium]
MFDLSRMYIDGRFVPVTGRPLLPLVDPATEEPSGAVPLASAEDVDAAVHAARAAFDAGWWRVEPDIRIGLLEALSREIARHAEPFARAISEEIGSPIDFARAHQVTRALGHLDDIITASRDLSCDEAISPDHPEDRLLYQPLGVAGLITPWNWPLNQIVLKVSAALAAGCTMVLKPSELSPRTGLLFAECVDRAGVPRGVFNMINGDGPVAGTALAAHSDVDIISFTGSTAAGRAVAVAAAQGFRRSILELGGKSANIVFADCDLPTAIRQGFAHCARNAGQSCNAASRMMVERSVYEQAVAIAAAAATATRVGPPDTAGSHIGPLVSRRQFAKVQELIQSGLAQGARLVAGGLGAPAGLDRGFYARPTVFADVTPGMRIAREEIFGPVLVMMPFDTEADAIRLANDTPYGLAAYVQTADPARARRLASALRVGMVQVNARSRAPGAPFGGVKQSGWGREAGSAGIRAFQEVKSVSGLSRP